MFDFSAQLASQILVTHPAGPYGTDSIWQLATLDIADSSARIYHGAYGFHEQTVETIEGVQTIGTVQSFAVPAPSSLALLSLGLAGLGFGRRYRQWQTNTV
jgi:hypothetical protein